MIYDFCSWRGMLVISGALAEAPADEHHVGTEDGRAGLWFGAVDDLFQLGAPQGAGGPWKNNLVEPGQPSDPYLMTGYDAKTAEFSHDLDRDVVFTVEVDFLGDGTWHRYGDFVVRPGQTLTHRFPDGYAAHWVRVRTDRRCTATAWFLYDHLHFDDGDAGIGRDAYLP